MRSPHTSATSSYESLTILSSFCFRFEANQPEAPFVPIPSKLHDHVTFTSRSPMQSADDYYLSYALSNIVTNIGLQRDKDRLILEHDSFHITLNNFLSPQKSMEFFELFLFHSSSPPKTSLKLTGWFTL